MSRLKSILENAEEEEVYIYIYIPMGKESKSAAGQPEADFKADFEMFCKAKEDTSARRKNLHVFRWYFFAAEKFIV